MAIVTVDNDGVATLPDEVLQHLGVKPGDHLELELLPDGTAILQVGKMLNE